MELTKHDFSLYLDCSKSFWLSKCEPENFPLGEFSALLEKLVREAGEVKQYAQELFAHVGNETAVRFDHVLSAADGQVARVDIMLDNPDGTVSIFVVKSSTRVKQERGDNHIVDACFQLLCAEKCGYRVKSVSVIHVNGKYVRQGCVDATQLLTVVDVTLQTKALKSVIAGKIQTALRYLDVDNIDRSSCGCLQKSRAHHCDCFYTFNAHVPPESIYLLPRLSDKKRSELLNLAVYALHDVPDDFGLSPQQLAVVTAAKHGEAQVIDENVCAFINKLKYPLYFFDYETFASAVPFTDGVKPHQQIPVQYSLHRLDRDGSLTHFEYLAMTPSLPEQLVLSMRSHIGETGSIVSWYDTFEKTRNKEMALMFPEHAAFLDDINRRMVNLEDVFKTDYVDIRFKGSTSIKKVLPVLCPGLSYKDLAVQDGTSAMEVWSEMTAPECENGHQQLLRSQLLKYCRLDTFAMVEIFNVICEQT